MSCVVRAQNQGSWNTVGGDSSHNNWQKGETKFTRATVAGEFKFLWKIKLGKQGVNAQSFSEPLLVPGLITSRGFKDMVLWGDSNTLYSVDADLGTLIWQKDFKVQSTRTNGACGKSNIQIVLESPHIIHFGAHSAVGHHPAPPSPPLSAARRVGAVTGGGGFGLKGIYVLTSDGYLHEQIMSSGLDYAPAVKFLPAPDGDFSALNMDEKVVYTATGRRCRNVPNGVWSIDINTPDYMVNKYETQRPSLAGLTGPAIGSDGTVYALTAGAPVDPSAGIGIYANSVVALTAKDLKVKDWYAPSDTGKGKSLNASPVVFTYKDKELVAAPGKDGSIVLLDSGSLGGPDHHTPLAQTGNISKSTRSTWESLASWQDNHGTSWVLVAISGPVRSDVKFLNTNGPVPHGSIIAFKIEDKDGHLTLIPSWISRDLKNPAPPAIADGIVFALAGGNASTRATLYALDATTGKELYSSGDTIETYTHLAGISIGNGQVFFTTHDNTLYSFGIPMEH